MGRNSKATWAKQRTTGFLKPCGTCGTPTTSAYCAQHLPLTQRSDLADRLNHEREVKRLRPKILRRDRWTCQSCGTVDKSGRTLQIDHLVPWQHGGPATEANLRALCIPCHRRKTADEAKARYPDGNPLR